MPRNNNSENKNLMFAMAILAAMVAYFYQQNATHMANAMAETAASNVRLSEAIDGLKGAFGDIRVQVGQHHKELQFHDVQIQELKAKVK